MPEVLEYQSAPPLTHEEWLESHLFLDAVSLALHRAIAERLSQNPSYVLSIARNNLQRWLSRNAEPAWREWQEILENSTPTTICEILSQDTEEGQRLRSATPFAGVLSESEREIIWCACAKRRFI